MAHYPLPRQCWLIPGVLALLTLLSACGDSATTGNTPQPVQPTPTPTAVPKTPTPAATLTAVQKIEQLVKSDATNASKTDITDNDGKTVNVQITLNHASDHAMYQSWIKQNCFAVQKALWTAGIKDLNDVNIAFRGVDFPGPIGRCELTAKIAKGYLWNEIDAGLAWDAGYTLAIFYPAIR